MINLISSFYTSNLKGLDNLQRNGELITALQYNLHSPYIEKLHLFVDDEPSLLTIGELASLLPGRVIIISLGKQPLYSDLFSYANKQLEGKLCMVTNSDIYLKDVEIGLWDKLNNSTVYSLTRYEYDMTSPLIDNYSGSHDCFIYKSPLPKSFIKKTNFPQNVWGSENVVIYELIKAGMHVLNPCYQFKIVHMHKSGVRNDGRVRINKSGRSAGSAPIML